MPSKRKRGGERPEVWLDRPAALARLRLWREQEPGRKNGERPANHQAIDDSVSELTAPGRGPKLRSTEELLGLKTPVLCPYSEARAGALLAAADVHDGMIERDGVKRKLYEDYAQEADRLSAGLRILLGGPSADSTKRESIYPPPVFLAEVPKRPALRDDKDDWSRRAKIAYDARDQIEAAIRSLSDLAELALSARAPLALRGRAGLSEEQIFVESLGYTWRRLTGHDPSPTSPGFLRFVERSYETASTDPRARTWENAITRVRERRVDHETYPGNTPVHEAWDRDERESETLAPGEHLVSIQNAQGDAQKRIAARIKLQQAFARTKPSEG